MGRRGVVCGEARGVCGVARRGPDGVGRTRGEEEAARWSRWSDGVPGVGKSLIARKSRGEEEAACRAARGGVWSGAVWCVEWRGGARGDGVLSARGGVWSGAGCVWSGAAGARWRGANPRRRRGGVWSGTGCVERRGVVCGVARCGPMVRGEEKKRRCVERRGVCVERRGGGRWCGAQGTCREIARREGCPLAHRRQISTRDTRV